MKQTLFDIALIVLAIASGSCLISLMVAFVGGRQGGPDVQGLMYMQAAIAPIALGIVIAVVYGFVAEDGWSKGLRAIWLALPQWLIFIFLLFNSLFLFGELAYMVVVRATDVTVHWYEHVRLVAMLMCSSAYLALYARKHSYPGSKPAISGRWM